MFVVCCVLFVVLVSVVGGVRFVVRRLSGVVVCR